MASTEDHRRSDPDTTDPDTVARIRQQVPGASMLPPNLVATARNERRPG